MEIAPYGITITLDQDGRCTGDAYVQFASPKDAEQALQKHKEKIGHRWDVVYYGRDLVGQAPSFLNVNRGSVDQIVNKSPNTIALGMCLSFSAVCMMV